MFDTMLASFVLSIYLYLHKYKLQYFGFLITFYHMAASKHISLNMSGPILIYNLTTGPYLLIPIYQIANVQVSTCMIFHTIGIPKHSPFIIIIKSILEMMLNLYRKGNFFYST